MLYMKTLFAAVVAACVLAATVPSHAQVMETPTVAVIDMKRIMSEANAAKDAHRQITQYRDSYRSQIAKEEDALRQEKEQLDRQRTILSQEAFNQKRQEFQRKVTDVQRKVQDRRKALEETLVEVRRQIGTTVSKIVNELANEKRFHIVVDRSQVMYVASNVEITSDVLAALNKQLATIKVPKPNVP
jgi:Skp family chaperone for outer membrane proteins